MGRTQPHVVKKFSIRLTETELKRITELAVKWREPKSQALRRVIDFFRLGQLSSKRPLVLPLTGEVAKHLFMCGVFEDQIRYLDMNCKRQGVSRAKFIRALIRRVPEMDELTATLSASVPPDSP